MDVVAVLSSLVGTDPHFQSPFSVAVSGSPWAAASDRRWFVAFKGPTTLQRLRDTPHVVSAQLYLSTPVPTDAPKVDAVYLRSWAGDVPADNEAYIEEDQRLGVILGTAIDRRRLAKILTAAPEGDLTVWIVRLGSEDAPVPVLGLASARWRGFLAALGCEPEEGDDTFAFPGNAIDMMDELPQD